MTFKDHPLVEIVHLSQELAEKMIDYGNEENPDKPGVRMIKVYSAYVISTNILSQILIASTGEYMDTLKKNLEKDIREDHL